MALIDKFADVKNRVANGEDDIQETTEFKGLEVDFYTQGDHLVVEADVDGNPHSSEVNQIFSDFMVVFGEPLLPNPDSGNRRASIRISNIKENYKNENQ